MVNKKAWVMVLVLLPFVATSRNVQADDQFTPMVVSPLTPTTNSVLGTDGKYHAVYELVLSNTRPVPATLKKIEVLDARSPSMILAAYEGEALRARLRTLNSAAASNAEIEFNGTRLLLLHLAFASRAEVPPRLLHHLELLGAFPGPAQTTPTPGSYTVTPFDLTARVLTIGPPLAGKHWVAFNGCCEANGAHRGTGLPVNGQMHFAQRFAIDWMRLDDQGRVVHDDPADVHNYTSYGTDVLAVADGTVVETLNTLDDQSPPHAPDPKTITLANVDGNHVVLDLGNSFRAFYAHMQKGSITVQPGARVKRGQVLGKLGNTGNSSAPHLHFHVMDGPSVLGSEGVPYVIDSFALAGQIPAEKFAAADTDAEFITTDWGQGLFAQPSPRHSQFPLDLTIVDFTP